MGNGGLLGGPKNGSKNGPKNGKNLVKIFLKISLENLVRKRGSQRRENFCLHHDDVKVMMMESLSV
jgi:hypothetical protein